MKKIYSCFFYHIYRSIANTGEDNISSAFAAMLVISFVQLLNLATIILIIDFFTMADVVQSIFSGKSNIVILALFLSVINSILLYRKNNYKLFIEENLRRNIKSRKIGAFLTLSYSLLSLIIVFILAPMVMNH